MSKLYELKEGDDIREIRLELTSDPLPETAVLILKNAKLGIRVERDLTEDSDGDWAYQFTDEDFDELLEGTLRDVSYKAEVYATFSDARNGTYPTKSTLTVTIYRKL